MYIIPSVVVKFNGFINLETKKTSSTPEDKGYGVFILDNGKRIVIQLTGIKNKEFNKDVLTKWFENSAISKASVGENKVLNFEKKIESELYNVDKRIAINLRNDFLKREAKEEFDKITKRKEDGVDENNNPYDLELYSVEIEELKKNTIRKIAMEMAVDSCRFKIGSIVKIAFLETEDEKMEVYSSNGISYEFPVSRSQCILFEDKEETKPAKNGFTMFSFDESKLPIEISRLVINNEKKTGASINISKIANKKHILKFLETAKNTIDSFKNKNYQKPTNALFIPYFILTPIKDKTLPKTFIDGTEIQIISTIKDINAYCSVKKIKEIEKEEGEEGLIKRKEEIISKISLLERYIREYFDKQVFEFTAKIPLLIDYDDYIKSSNIKTNEVFEKLVRINKNVNDNLNEEIENRDFKIIGTYKLTQFGFMEANLSGYGKNQNPITVSYEDWKYLEPFTKK